jgi:outer membrane protein OmpA-like peptidoglycan-associated protein
MKKNLAIKIFCFCILEITGSIYAQENNYITSKYDFIPGEEVIFFDDFSSENIGDFPAQWLTNGSGEIVTSQKFPGKWFNITKMGYYIPEAKDDFTENFTIEFDFIPMTTDNGENLYSFTFYLLTGSLGEPGGGGEPGDAGFQVYSDGENLGWKNWSMASEQRFNGNVTFPFKTNQKYHVAIWVQKQRVRIYADENKVLDVPRGIPTGSKPNIFRFETRDEAIPLIANFRIAAGLSDMRNMLLKNGKIISYGILFDVNSDKLKPESYSTLKVISDILKEDPALKLQVVGHTDSDGDDASNLDLSKRRAVSVKNELVSKFGADASRLETDGKGESEPIGDNNSSVNKAKNRRVEFINLKNSTGAVNPSTGTKVTVAAAATEGLGKKGVSDENAIIDQYILSRSVVKKDPVTSGAMEKVFSGIFLEAKWGYAIDDGFAYCSDILFNINEGKVTLFNFEGKNLSLFIRKDFTLANEEDALIFDNALKKIVRTRSGVMDSEFRKKDNKWYFIRDEYSESKGGFVVTVDQKSNITSIDYDSDIKISN